MIEKNKAEESMRLNKYLSNSGIAKRRAADDLIKKGLVKVNNKVVKEMGYKVQKGDKVQFKDEELRWPEKLVHVLMNKPKDCVTEGESESYKRVLQFVQNIEVENLFCVDYMAPSELGLLLITNDEVLANKLRDPELRLRKIYLLKLNEPLSPGAEADIKQGIELEGKIVEVEEIAFPDPESRSNIGIEIWDNRKGIVQKLFEDLGYETLKIDRTIYANLSKKDLPRGKWRFIEEKELRTLKRFI